MAQGTVKWFNLGKGYGFITDDQTKEDYFVHFSEIQMDGFKKLKASDEVEFTPAQNDKGKVAKNVVITKAAP